MKPMLKSMLLTISILSSGWVANAQTGGPKVNGQILQSTNKPVEFATVTLLKAKDSSLVKGAIADIQGKYEFEQVKQGRYIVAAAYVGMTKVYSQPFEVQTANTQLPVLTLSTSSKNLKAVDVTARKPFVEQRADKMVVNPEASITAGGGTAMEVLEKSPTINVDKDGNISMKGKSGVVIMIDGKQTNMSSQEIAELLKSMPGSNLEQIELIANPSAKYDAAGNAGIINLKLKKNRNYGTNGSVTLGVAQGIVPKYNGGINLNHRNQKVNIYGSYNYNHREGREKLGLFRSLTDNGAKRVFDQTTNMDRTSDYHGVKAGVDYFINKNHTIGAMVDFGMRDRTGITDGRTYMGDGFKMDSLLHTLTNDDQRWRRGAYNLNYRGILDSTGKELNVDLDYARNTNREDANIYAGIFDPTGKRFAHGDTSRNLTPSEIDIKTIKVDYTHPLKNQAKLEAGFKLSFVGTDNNARFDSLRGKNWLIDTTRSNHFIYKENVNAGYINYFKEFKKFSLQLGLRAEQTNVKGNSVTRNQVNDTSYFNLFPSMAVTYKANKDNTFGLTYSRRIQRPSYEDLNPFEYYLDRYTKAAGNPYLRPQYSNNFELNHTFKGFIITSLGYSHTKDMMTRLLEADRDPATGDTTILRYKYMNVAKSDNFNLNISVPMPITKWWSSFTTVSAGYNMFKTVVNNNPVDLNSTTFFGRTQHTFTLPAGIALEAVFFYVAPQITEEGLFKMKSMYALDLGVQKQVLRKKGTLKLNVSDVFRTQYFRGDFENAGRYSSVMSRWESRQVRLNFSYRFGNTNVKAARNRKTGLDAEQSRVKGGGN